jgi:hypothetical protein
MRSICSCPELVAKIEVIIPFEMSNRRYRL